MNDHDPMARMVEAAMQHMVALDPDEYHARQIVNAVLAAAHVAGWVWCDHKDHRGVTQSTWCINAGNQADAPYCLGPHRTLLIGPIAKTAMPVSIPHTDIVRDRPCGTYCGRNNKGQTDD